MGEEISIVVHNNDEAWHNRKAPVEMSLAKIKAKYHLKEWDITRLQVLDTQGEPVQFQIDQVDLDDPTKDILVFTAEVPEKSSNYLLSETKYRPLKEEKTVSKIMPIQKEMFSIDTGAENDLNENIIPENLKDRFKTKGFPLSDNATVTKEKENKWVISDKERTYIIRREEGELNIYEIWDFKLENDKIELQFHRGRTPLGYLAGSTFNMKIKGGADLMKPFGDEYDAPEWMKKLMQIEEIWVSLPWNPAKEQHWYLANQDYEYVNSGEGPIRCFLTLRSNFKMEFENPLRSGPGKIITRYDCYLYRIISLYSGKDYINEDIYAEAKKYTLIHEVDGKSFEIKKVDDINLPLNFRTRFLMFVPGLRSHDTNFEKIHPLPDWFAVGNDSFPHPGIGFASNCHIESLSSFGDSFRWAISPTWHVRCLHQFMEGKNTPIKGEKHDFGHVVGSNWYDAIYTPLWGV